MEIPVPYLHTNDAFLFQPLLILEKSFQVIAAKPQERVRHWTPSG
jgi:hypothetical protein